MFKVKRRLSSRRKRSSKRGATTSSSVSDTPAASHSSSNNNNNLRGILRLPYEYADQQDQSSVDGESHSKRSAASLSWTATSGQSSSLETGKSSPTHDNNNSNIMKPKRVLFGSVHVREYERALGDNPSCSSGAPLTIGWGYDKECSHPVDEFENARLDQRRSQPELILTRQMREELLLEWGASFHDIIDAIRTNVRVKNQRRRTVNAIGTYDRWEEVMENAGRKIKKTLMLQKIGASSSSTSSSNSSSGYNSHHLPKPARRISLDGGTQGKEAKKDNEVSSLEEIRPSTSINVAPGLKKSASADAIATPHPLGQPATLVVETNPNTGSSTPEESGIPETSVASGPSNGEGEEKASISSPSSFLDIDLDVSSMASGSDFADQYNEDFGDLVSEEAGNDDDDDDTSTIKTIPSIMEARPQERGNNPIIVNAVHLFQTAEDDDFSSQYGSTVAQEDNNLVDGDDDNESDIAFENLRRDYSFWEVDGRSTGPGIRRKITPVVISEDNSDLPYYGDENHWASGFRMHPPPPPPYSSSIISQWE